MPSIRYALQRALDDEALRRAERLNREELILAVMTGAPCTDHHQRNALKTAARRVLWSKHPKLAKELLVTEEQSDV